MRWTVGVAVAVALALGAGCGGDDGPPAATSPDGAAALDVVTTTTQVTDFASVIGGGDVRIHALLKANVDPHDYEPTPADLDAIARADVIVRNGVGLEKWFEDTIKSAEPRGTIVDASHGVAVREGTDDEADGDPHIWHNPQNAKVMVTNIADAFATAAPGSAAGFRARLASYSQQLDALDADIARQVATLTNRKLVTNHDAFGYFVDHFGLEYVGSIIPSFDTQAELSPSDINELVDAIRSQGAKAVFSESSLPPKTAEAIAEEAGVKVVAGEDALYGDSLGPSGSDAATYLTMEAHNARVIVENLR